MKIPALSSCPTQLSGPALIVLSPSLAKSQSWSISDKRDAGQRSAPINVILLSLQTFIVITIIYQTSNLSYPLFLTNHPETQDMLYA